LKETTSRHGREVSRSDPPSLPVRVCLGVSAPKPIDDTERAEPVHRANEQMSATVKLTRKAPVMEIQHRGTFDVVADGDRVGSIESDGDTFETPVASGRHTLKVRDGRYSSRELSFEVTDGQVISFRCHGRRIPPIWLASFVMPRWALKLRPD
jgi:hypothetical protein